MIEMDAKVERIALAMTREGDVEKSALLAHLTLQASAEVIAACLGPIAAAEACYRLADVFACMGVEK